MANIHYTPPTNTMQRIEYNRQWLQSRNISDGRIVYFYDFQGLKPKFTRMGWFSFLTHDGGVFPSLLREFYSNFEFTNTRLIKFRMFDSSYQWSLRKFGDILKVPYHGLEVNNFTNQLDFLPSFLPKTEVVSTLLDGYGSYNNIRQTGLFDYLIRPEYTTWSHIIKSNIFCRNEEDTRLSVTELTLLWCLHQETPVNIAYLMASRMNNLHYDPNRLLPYGLHLSLLFEHLDLLDPFPSDGYRTPNPPVAINPNRAFYNSWEYDLNNP